MKLWVRSQNKEALIKVDGLRTYYTEISGESVYEIEDCKYNILGTYKSKERTLEVLDEIQTLLKSKVLLNSGKILESFEDTIYREPNKVEIQELNTIVYEMPKE